MFSRFAGGTYLSNEGGGIALQCKDGQTCIAAAVVGAACRYELIDSRSAQRHQARTLSACTENGPLRVEV